MKDAILFHKESDFRKWFEANLEAVGVKRIILSQEVCPDYVVEMLNGEIAKLEVELFAINFKYHKHDPNKADYILACYANEQEVLGVPVIAINKLWDFEIKPLTPLPPEGPLSEDEFILLGIISFHVSIEISSLTNERFSGDQSIFIRFPPGWVSSAPHGKFPRGKIEDNLFNVISPETKKYIKKYHHIMIGSNLSKNACVALSNLTRRGLIKIRPISFMSALYDGTCIKHDGWIPTEVYLTDIAKSIYMKELKEWHISQLKSRQNNT